MPYLLLARPTPPDRFAAATARWERILASRPDLEPAVALQRTLVLQVADLADLIDRGRLPKLSLPPKYLAAKLSRGVPVLSGEPIPLPVAPLRAAMLGFCRALAAGGAGEAADHIARSIETADMDAGSLLNASLSRNQEAIRTGAVHRGIAPDLLWLVAELAVGPFAHALQRTLFSSEDPALSSALTAWNHGYCPACGSWPALAEVAGGRRVLRCSLCAAAWELTTYACVYCNEEGDPFITAAPDPERKDRRLELCSACGAYMKTVDVPELSPFPLLAIADLETMDLDIAAMENRYARPPLRDFTSTIAG